MLIAPPGSESIEPVPRGCPSLISITEGENTERSVFCERPQSIRPFCFDLWVLKKNPNGLIDWGRSQNHRFRFGTQTWCKSLHRYLKVSDQFQEVSNSHLHSICVPNRKVGALMHASSKTVYLRGPDLAGIQQSEPSAARDSRRSVLNCPYPPCVLPKSHPPHLFTTLFRTRNFISRKKQPKTTSFAPFTAPREKKIAS